MKRKISLVILSSLFLGLLATVSPVVLAQGGLEITYPRLLPFINPPTTTRTFLPEYFKYWMDVALVIAGLIAFFSLLLAGFNYLTSSGNPSQLQDSKDQAISAFLGMAILFASYSFFQTINPQLTVFKRPGFVVAEFGVDLCEAADCGASGIVDHIQSSQADLKNRANASNQVVEYLYQGIQFVPPSSPDKLEVTLYSTRPDDSHPRGECTIMTIPAGVTSTATICSGQLSGPLAFRPAYLEAIALKMKTEGVYLFNDVNYGGKSAYFDRSTSGLGEFNDWADSIKIMGDGVRAILHQNTGYQGRCSLFYGNDENLSCPNSPPAKACGPGTDNNVVPYDAFVPAHNWVSGNEASSLTVFKTLATPTGEGVYFYSETEFKGKKWGPFSHASATDPGAGWSYGQLPAPTDAPTVLPQNDKVASLEIKGDYIVALFSDYDFDGECEVFDKSNMNLLSHRIGQCFQPGCWCVAGNCFYCPSGCVSSIIIYPAKKLQ